MADIELPVTQNPGFKEAGTETSHIPVRISYRIIELFSDGLYASPNKAIEELVKIKTEIICKNVEMDLIKQLLEIKYLRIDLSEMMKAKDAGYRGLDPEILAAVSFDSRLTELESRNDVPEWVRAYLGFIWSSVESDSSSSLAKVNDSPDDPWLHLDLLDARLTEGNYTEANSEVRIITELASNDPLIYFTTGEILASHGIWTHAASFYIRSAEFYREPSNKVVEKIHMAVYYSGSLEDSLEVLSQPDIGLDSQLL